MRRSVENAVRPDPSGLNFAISLHLSRVANSVALVNRRPPIFAAGMGWKTAPARTIMELMESRLNEIGNSEAATLEGPVALLLGCHQRIRHFTSMAVRLADNPEAPAAEVCAAAEAIAIFLRQRSRCTRLTKTNRS